MAQVLIVESIGDAVDIKCRMCGFSSLKPIIRFPNLLVTGNCVRCHRAINFDPPIILKLCDLRHWEELQWRLCWACNSGPKKASLSSVLQGWLSTTQGKLNGTKEEVMELVLLITKKYELQLHEESVKRLVKRFYNFSR